MESYKLRLSPLASLVILLLVSFAYISDGSEKWLNGHGFDIESVAIIVIIIIIAGNLTNIPNYYNYFKNNKKRKEGYWEIHNKDFKKDIVIGVSEVEIEFNNKNVYVSDVEQYLFHLMCMVAYYNDKKLSNYEFKYLFNHLNNHSIKDCINDRDIVVKEELLLTLDQVNLSLSICENKNITLEIENFIDYYSDKIKNNIMIYNLYEYIINANSTLILIFQLLMDQKTRLISVDDLFIMECLKEKFTEI